MPVTIVATPGASNANSFLTLEEYNDYIDSRLTYESEAADADDDTKNRALVMATRTLSAVAQPYKRYVSSCDPKCPAHYETRPTWTGSPSTTTQALAWPRSGMYDMNGNAIPDDVIPQALKDATAELAFSLIPEDRTADNEIGVQGITRLKVSTIEMSFRDDAAIKAKPIPDAVVNLMPPSWFTDVIIEYVNRFAFQML